MSIICPKCQHDNPSDSKYCKEYATPLPIEKGQPSFTKTLETPVEELIWTNSKFTAAKCGQSPPFSRIHKDSQDLTKEFKRSHFVIICTILS